MTPATIKAAVKARIKAACRTNEPQFNSCLGLTAANGAICYQHNAPLAFWVALLLFWPVLAFVGNLIDPIP